MQEIEQEKDMGRGILWGEVSCREMGKLRVLNVLQVGEL